MWIMMHYRHIVMLVGGLLLLAACGAPAATNQSPASASDGTLGAVAQAASHTELQGTVRSNGSSALLPLMRLATDVFQSTHPNVHFVGYRICTRLLSGHLADQDYWV